MKCICGNPKMEERMGIIREKRQYFVGGYWICLECGATAYENKYLKKINQEIDIEYDVEFE